MTSDMGTPSPASPPTMNPGEGWTVATYAAHNEAMRHMQWRFDAERDRRYAELAAAREKAVEVALEKATAALDIRLESMNEFRDQITNERGEYARKDQVEGQLTAIRGDIRRIQDRDTKGDGRNLGLMGVGLAAVGSLLISVFNFVIRG